MIIDPEDRQHLMYLIEAIEEVQGYVEGMDYNDFALDEYTKEEVARTFQDIGGAAKMLSEEFTSQFGDIDWKALIRLEDAMYDQSVEQATGDIWNIIKTDFKKLKDEIADLAANLDSEEDIQGTTIDTDRKTKEQEG